MGNIFSNMLAIDAQAQKVGCGLKPELRQAIETSLRFPAYAASPAPRPEVMEGDLPGNVTVLKPVPNNDERKRG